MSILLTATFDTRREADMTVERLVQEFGLDRAAIFIAAEGDGETPDGADSPTARAGDDWRDDGAADGGVIVSVEVADEGEAHTVAEAFEAFNATGVVVSCDSYDAGDVARDDATAAT